MRLKDKVAIITGAASGIGKDIAIVFAHEGAKVAIADLNQNAADATAHEIDPGGKRAIGVAMDVTDEHQVETGTVRVIEAFGALDILVSNAGIQIVAPLVEFEFAKWKKLLAIHLDGAFLTTRAALRQMYKQGSGSVIYMGSAHSKEASVLKGPYVTAKHGLIGSSKSCRQGRRRAWRPCKCNLPRLCSHSAGREADSRAGERARHFGAGSDQECDAKRDCGWRIYARG